MPVYQYRCPDGHHIENYTTLANHTPSVECYCGQVSTQIISAPIMVKAQQDCHYTSPVDGTPITSWAARRNDLDKHNCQEYDPEMKRDYLRRQKESQQALEKALDTQVEAAIEKMPTKQRGKLHSELVEQGMTATVERGSAEA